MTKKDYRLEPVVYMVERSFGKKALRELITEKISKENDGIYEPLLTTTLKTMYNISGSVGEDINANR